MVVKKVGSKYKVVSKTTGKNLSKPMSKEGADKREKQVEMFKNNEKYKKDHGKGFLKEKKKK